MARSALALVVTQAMACGQGASPTSGRETTPDASPPLCTPGATLACRCGAAMTGTQTCQASGDRYSACACLDAAAPADLDAHASPPDAPADAGPDASDGGICSLPTSYGVCGQDLQKWTFRPLLNACVPFNYSGCGGTANRFDTEAECEGTCGGILYSRCAMPRGGCPNDFPICNYTTDGCQCIVLSLDSPWCQPVDPACGSGTNSPTTCQCLEGLWKCVRGF
jgi:hypothetical protein